MVMFLQHWGQRRHTHIQHNFDSSEKRVCLAKKGMKRKRPLGHCPILQGNGVITDNNRDRETLRLRPTSDSDAFRLSGVKAKLLGPRMIFIPAAWWVYWSEVTGVSERSGSGWANLPLWLLRISSATYTLVSIHTGKHIDISSHLILTLKFLDI